MKLKFNRKENVYCINILNINDEKLIRKPGIYACFNFHNNKIYIGKSKNIFNRIRAHYVNAFEKNTNTIFYSAMRAHNCENMVWLILDILPKNDMILNDIEKYYISFYNSNVVGYNMTSGGDGGDTTKGASWIHKGLEQKMVKSDLISHYIELGYSLGRSPYVKFNTIKGKIKVNNTKECILIEKNLLQHYESIGYQKGELFLENKGKSFIGRVGIKKEGLPNKYVHKSELDFYISMGYSLGSIVKNRKIQEKKRKIYKNSVERIVPLSQLDEYIKQGYTTIMPPSRKRRVSKKLTNL